MADIPLIFVYRETVKQELAGWFGKYYDNIETAVSYNLVRNAVSMVQNGVGAAICYVLDDEYKGVKTIPLSPPLEAGAVLAWKKNSRHQLHVLNLYKKSGNVFQVCLMIQYKYFT